MPDIEPRLKGVWPRDTILLGHSELILSSSAAPIRPVVDGAPA